MFSTTPQARAVAAPSSAKPSGGGSEPLSAPRHVALWSDDSASDAHDPARGLRALAEALVGEGLAPAPWPADADPLTADALLLVVRRGLADQLARLRSLRQQSPWTPLMVACAPLRELDQVLALKMGADDVVDAAWSAAVIAARLRALWRRGGAPHAHHASAADVLRFGRLAIRLRERDVRLAGRLVPLTEGEFEVLWLLASHAGTPLSRRDILKRVRGLEDQPLDRSIDSRVYRIRAKLEDTTAGAQRIRTVRNRGYLFSPVGW
jgi:two-component system, OmpR family, response regulator RstA